ncbi:hypothetical protein G7Y89_g2256 [Cudoniella acicularis]|uniref:Uncharacterized protein n=1 Tax=Cudoniella acicularis TaxID=354080 RepID=A0A8H4RTN7_9HELO|nr:hypothetical protein G7Y89_g2256 [Cudoniella acicularis]
MGIFNRSSEPVADEKVPQRSSTLFSRRRSVSPVNNTTTHHNNNSTDLNNTSPQRHGFLHRNNGEDASIIAAKERVQNAEQMERDADKALAHARAAVREAREHVKRIEKEAAEQARLAKIKQKQASSISKRARPLGRHDQHHVI